MKLTYSLVFFGLLFLLVGCVTQKEQPQQTALEQSQQSVPCEQRDSADRAQCMLDKVSASGSITQCNNVNDVSLYQNCVSIFIEQAITNKDVSICGNNDACIFQFVNATKNKEICKKLSVQDLMDYCEGKI